MNVSLIKAGTYCLMHLAVAVAVAFALTGDWTAALAIGVVEPFFQTFAFVLHDRFWARYDGRMGVPDRPSLHGGCTHGGFSAPQALVGRSASRVFVLKTASYGAMHMLVAVTVAYALTGSWRAALAIGIIEPLVQTIAFTFHDRLWSRRDVRAVPA